MGLPSMGSSVSSHARFTDFGLMCVLYTIHIGIGVVGLLGLVTLYVVATRIQTRCANKDTAPDTPPPGFARDNLLHFANIGALIIRTGFWGALYYNCNKEPPK